MRKELLCAVFMLTLLATIMPAMLVKASPGGSIVGLWHFDQVYTDPITFVQTTPDSSGNGYTGTLMPLGSEPTLVPGKFGKALSFDGVGKDNYVDCGGLVDDTITTTYRLTLEAWIKPAVATQRGGIISNDVTYITKKGYDFFLWDGKLYIDVGTAVLGRVSCPLSDTEWHYVAATWDSSTVTLYVDGTETGHVSLSGTYADPGQNTWIGKINPTSYPSDWPFNGIIDEVRIWDQALTADQVEASYKLGLGTEIGQEDLDGDGYPDVIFTSAFYNLASGYIITATILPVDPSVTIDCTLTYAHHVTPKGTIGSIVKGSPSLSGYSLSITVYQGLPPCKSIHIWLYLSTGDHLGVNAQFLPYN